MLWAAWPGGTPGGFFFASPGGTSGGDANATPGQSRSAVDKHAHCKSRLSRMTKLPLLRIALSQVYFVTRANQSSWRWGNKRVHCVLILGESLQRAATRCWPA